MQFRSSYSVPLRSALILSFIIWVFVLNFVLIKNSSYQVTSYYKVYKFRHSRHKSPFVYPILNTGCLWDTLIIGHWFYFSGLGNATAAAEFNFSCDPEAAHIVIHNMKCPITIFPWEAAYKYGRLSYVSKTYCQ